MVRRRTHLIQLYTQDPDEGPRLISDFHPQGIPIMVIVDPPSCCYYKLNIPHGIVSLEQVNGRHTGQMTPGYHCCYCSYKRIAAMITKNSIQFNTPIEACPTKDNVRVSVDIGITFHIGKDGTRDKDCERFLYYLGANKLEELLEQESEESIRNFIRTIKVNQIRDIKSELTSLMIEELNSRFNEFGVYVERVNVMNVIIPKDLRIALSQATTYDVFLQNQVRFQENVRIRMMNENNMTLQTLIRENQKKMLDLKNKLAMEEIFLQKFKVESETTQSIQIIKANQNQEIKLIQAQSNKNLAERRAKKEAEKILAEAKAYSEGKLTRTNAKKLNLQTLAQARLQVAKLRSDGQIKEAGAEESFATNLQMKRKHEQRMKKSDNLNNMMKDNKIIISGENGQDLLDYFSKTSEMLQRKGSTDSYSESQQQKKDLRQNIKNSLEQQKLQNKTKFEDPFFIQIGDGLNSSNGSSTSALKIVKARNKDGNDTVDFDEAIEDNESNNRGQGRRPSQIRQQQTLKRGASQLQQRVMEAREEEESSPKLKGQRSPTRNNQIGQSTKKLGVEVGQNVMNDSDKFERVSEAAAPKTLPQLVKLDVNMDTLKNYLEDFQEAINDHAKSIGLIQSDLKKKATEKAISHYFSKISSGLHKECGERPHAFRLDNDESNFLSDNYQSQDSVQMKRMAEKLMEKLEIIGLNIINTQKFKGHTEDRLEKLERIIPKCFTVDQFREESQALEQRTLKYINEQLGTFQENLNGYKKELNEALTHFDKKVNDNQSATLWRIKDCEDLLKSRVSDKYVNDAIKAVEEKVMKQLSYSDEKQIERLEKSFKELGMRVVQTNQFFNEKFEDLRKVISMYDQKIMNLATNEKLISVQTGYRDMKYNIEREMELLQEHVKETKDKIGELNKRFSNLEIATNSLANGGDFNYQMTGHGAAHHNPNSNQGTSRNQFQSNMISDNKRSQKNLQQANTNNNASPQSKDRTEQFAQVQTPSIQQVNNSPGGFSPMLRKRQARVADAALMAEMDKRIQQYDEQFDNMNSKIESLKKQMDDKVTKEDVRKLTSDKITKEDLDHIIPSEEITSEKMKYLVRDEIENLQNKLNEQFKQYDNKMIRLRAELDIHSIQRQLERKANEDQVRSDFGNHEFKIGTLDRNIIRMANDFETFQMAINKMHSAIVELQEANRDVLLGKKTNNCLSCGKGGDTVQTIKGKDGKMYKAADQAQARLYQDDSGLIGNNYQQYESQTPLTGPGTNQLNHLSQNQSGIDLNTQQEFFKMRPSQSFYDSAYDNNVNGTSLNQQNLPQVHTKKGSFGSNLTLMKNMASLAGITGINNGGSGANLSQVNSSFTHHNKKKLPFGFQVQQEKKELFKVGQRGKSSQMNKRATSTRGGGAVNDGRPDSAKYRDMGGINFNNTFEQ